MTIRNDFGLYEVRPGSIAEFVRKQSIQAEKETINSTRAVGIEVELENHHLVLPPDGNVWREVNDGSLRNNGAEYVTQPIMAMEAPLALHELLNVCLAESCCFGPRTSTHVHINAQDLTQEQVKRIVTVYCVFETVLFNFVGKGRRKNIFCVPITETNLLREFNSHNLQHATERWSKYTALNLLPLRDKGTMEFRHMHGTSNVTKMSQWIRLLLRIFEYATEDKFDEKEFNKYIETLTALNVRTFMDRVFKQDAPLLPYTGWRDVKDCVTAMHQMYSRSNVITTLANNRVAEAPFYQFGA